MENTSKVRERETDRERERRRDREREREMEREREEGRKTGREREKRERWMKEGLDENINLLILFSSPKTLLSVLIKLGHRMWGHSLCLGFMCVCLYLCVCECV